MVAHDPGGVLIIGGGLCAAVVAHRLVDAGVPVRVLCPDDEPAIDRVLRQAAIGSARHRGLATGWADGVGGTTRLWGGQLWPWAPDDHGSGWPEWVRSLDHHYEAVARLLDSSPRSAALHAPSVTENVDVRRLWPELAEAFELRSSSWLPRRRRSVGPIMRRLLRHRPGSLVTGHASRVEIDGARAVVTVDGPVGSREIPASTVVIAAGTLGTLDLLRRSRSAEGIWPALGAGMVDHTSFHLGTIRARDEPRLLSKFADRFDGGRRRTPKLVFRDATSGRRAYAHLRPARPDRHTLRSAAAPSAVSAALASVAGRRLPAPLGLEVRVDVEQLTSDGHHVDFGEDPPRLVWDVTDAERAMASQVGQKVLDGLGALADGDVVVQATRPSTGEDIYHLMGGARLGDDADGVVTAQLRLTGMPQVAVVGLSVFPEAGVANPSYLAASMASWLADQIVSERS